MDFQADAPKLEPKTEKSFTAINFTTGSEINCSNQMTIIQNANPAVNLSSVANFKCSICSEVFEFKSQQIIHEMSHKIKINCQVCSKKIYKENLNNHMEIHLQNKCFYCEFCNERFGSKHLVLLHLRSKHIQSKAYNCSCGRGFNDKRHYKNHLLTHIDNHPFKCDLCPKSYARKQTLEVHIIGAHQTERKLKCSLCDYESNIPAELKNHRMTHLEKFKCEICHNEYKERRNLKLHFEAQHIRTQNYQCLVCEKKFLTAKYVKRHLRLIHNDDLKKFRCLDPDIEAKKKKLKVPDIASIRRNNQKHPEPRKSTSKIIKLRNKIQMSIDNEFNVALSDGNLSSSRTFHDLDTNISRNKSIQDQQISTSSIKIKQEPEEIDQNPQFSLQLDPSIKDEPQVNLNSVDIKQEYPNSDIKQEPEFTIIPYQPKVSFSSIRLTNQTFTCSICSSSFKNRSSLLLHESKCKVEDTKTIKCSFCSKTFSDKFTMEVHVNVRHANAKLHKCSQCDFSTSRNSEFRSHKLTHMKLVKCEKCEKNFPDEKSMMEHLTTSHGGFSELRCEFCGESFKKNVLLQRHVKSNHSTSKVTCSYCDKTFDTQNELNTHVGSLWKIKKCSSYVKHEDIQ